MFYVRAYSATWVRLHCPSRILSSSDIQQLKQRSRALTASSVCHRRRKLVWECFPGSSIVSVEGQSVEAAKPRLCANTFAGAEAGLETLTPCTIPNTF